MATSEKRRWFLPDTPDLLGMLREQIDVTADGVSAFAAWARGDAERADDVREAEHTADVLKKRLINSVRDAFTTPLEPEDLFELSHGLDEVLNHAKNVVREAEVMQVTPDQAVAEMATLVDEGISHLKVAFDHLSGDGNEATTAANAAVKTQRNLERVYRHAMSDLLHDEDLRSVISRQELYRRMSRIAEELLAVADRVWYSTVKEA
jgi:uncharacterized protein Yka (UPF0111/DUF47 family)